MLLLPLPRDSLELFPHIRRTACRKLDMIQGLVTPWMPCNREIVRNSTHTRSSPGRAVLVRPHHLYQTAYEIWVVNEILAPCDPGSAPSPNILSSCCCMSSSWFWVACCCA